jgi:hypothetical protein
MKLVPPAWQTAWYEEGLSERFVQEMTRLEKSAVRDLGTSAQWVEQLVIELGQLTQNMIHLEGEVPRPHQLRLALERALKLAALSAHLMAALDRALDHGPAVLRYSEGAESAARGAAFPASALPAPGHGPAAPVPSEPGRPIPEPAVHPASQHAPPGSAQPPGAAALRASPQVQVGMKRQSGPDPRPAAPAAPAARESAKPAPFVNNLMELSQPMIDGPASPAREMILALSRRGLSRSEIEVITEQPRHIIEAVLQRG